ncbi:hypothetical protein BH10CYA1_BH10CYA1_28460 [soil metagenome]
MNKLHKIAMISLLSISAAMYSTQAKADEKDGTIERFVCLQDNVEPGHLKSAFVKLNANEISQKFGFGGGSWALKLSNDGEGTPGGFTSYTGGAATFVPQKKEAKFLVYFKPVNVDIDHVRLFICMTLPSGKPSYLFGQLAGFIVKPVGNGWFTVGEDLETYNGEFNGAIVNRITVALSNQGDVGHILMGNTQVISHKDLLDPSTLIMDKVPCNSNLTCGALVQ